MTKVLLTGMSGTGKSTVLEALRERGWRTVDTDVDGLVDEYPDRTELRLPEIEAILRQPRNDRPLVVAATGEGQETLYPFVDAVVLLTAPWPVMQERLMTRPGNDFGKDPGELERVRMDTEDFEPLLRRGADLVLDTGELALEEVVDRIDGLATVTDGVRR
ncbi:AAA family ATPase [Ornithinimicrobium humiphilum]|uniref:Shikimate kinase n=1 Tax=Ornithinimicrobium humiphilum TaxID=125288 RepID=A0A543K6G4_9MICO|nr:AAA family ATPase [Ornithinimicrobium humiphilum]TQM90676.1 shikimate kinase [Ornithinimicrobium humiphilum]